ncbi:MAG: c-type cytochrome domain-containing protein, partial [Planctomycetota bacterium]
MGELFESNVKPLLASKCFECHGPETQESHLRLDRRSSMLRGGDSGEPAIIVGDSEKSHLLALVSGHEAGKLMPPDESNRLTESEIRILRTWIDSGAIWPGSENETDTEASELDHWSFKPVVAVVPPSVSSDFVSNPLDVFIF